MHGEGHEFLAQVTGFFNIFVFNVDYFLVMIIKLGCASSAVTADT